MRTAEVRSTEVRSVAKVRSAAAHQTFRSVLLLWLVAFSGTFLFAQPAGYYAMAEGKQGEELQWALHEIIDDHVVLSYSDLWTAFRSTDKRADGSVWDMYSDRPGDTPPYVYTFGTDQCGNYSGEESCYNREHSFPKSWFNDASPMYTDLFHLYPTDGYVNGKRSNFLFGETGNASWTSLNGCEVGPSSVDGYSGTVFEPIDAYKGDFARTYFYMATRYYGEDAGWPGSPMVDGAQLEPWAREMMVRWHNEDPVSGKETARNDAVYALQRNRNPFIDRPEFVQLMYSDGGGEIPDELAPDLDSITVVSATEITLLFNEPLDSLNASDPSHYKISSSVVVERAAWSSANPAGVLLGVSGLENGTYSLILNGVSDTSGNVLQQAFYPFEVTTLSGEGMSAGVDFRVYPNPSEGIFHIEFSGNHGPVDQLVVLDIAGQRVPAEWSRYASGIRVSTPADAGAYLVAGLLKGTVAWRFRILVY
ncbi:MAG: endonuclease [Bacteroidales bacterium]|nr:endonuclease [Bacteroidales bacterium]